MKIVTEEGRGGSAPARASPICAGFLGRRAGGITFLRLAAEAGMSLVPLAVAWVLAHPAITAPIIGASRPEQLDDVLAAVDQGSTRA